MLSNVSLPLMKESDVAPFCKKKIVWISRAQKVFQNVKNRGIWSFRPLMYTFFVLNMKMLMVCEYYENYVSEKNLVVAFWPKKSLGQSNCLILQLRISREWLDGLT